MHRFGLIAALLFFCACLFWTYGNQDLSKDVLSKGSKSELKPVNSQLTNTSDVKADFLPMETNVDNSQDEGALSKPVVISNEKMAIPTPDELYEARLDTQSGVIAQSATVPDIEALPDELKLMELDHKLKMKLEQDEINYSEPLDDEPDLDGYSDSFLLPPSTDFEPMITDELKHSESEFFNLDNVEQYQVEEQLLDNPSTGEVSSPG